MTLAGMAASAAAEIQAQLATCPTCQRAREERRASGRDLQVRLALCFIVGDHDNSCPDCMAASDQHAAAELREILTAGAHPHQCFPDQSRHGDHDMSLTDDALQQIEKLFKENLELQAERDGVYRERAHLVALLATIYPSYIGRTDPETPDWPVVTVELPTGQACWHVAARDMDLFAHVQPTPRYARGWDGHGTEEKYRRIAELAAGR